MNAPLEAPPRLPSSDGLLVADVGGSNARFGWHDLASGRVVDVASAPISRHSSLTDAARDYLTMLAHQRGAAYQRPRRAALAVATAVSGDRVEFTNSAWSFSTAEVAAALDLTELQVVNDFEALALALPHLQPHQLHSIGPSMPGVGASRNARRTLAVVGPGTGLGVACVVQTAAGWLAVPGEGGHATLAAGTQEEDELLRRVRRAHPHVSAERLLSGIGLPTLYLAVADLHGESVDPLEAPAILEAGLAGERIAKATLDHFCALLGSFAGNVALTVGAREGVFIGGGIVPRLGATFEASAFRARFEAKGRLGPYLATIPTAVITDTLAALTGAAAVITQSGRGAGH